ncbi:MAG: hypothetical protein KGI75_04645 [Rhizobiaceae bacterium]|nr:hypothetical protein [Rhizobiaceae bacterium]
MHGSDIVGHFEDFRYRPDYQYEDGRRLLQFELVDPFRLQARRFHFLPRQILAGPGVRHDSDNQARAVVYLSYKGMKHAQAQC